MPLHLVSEPCGEECFIEENWKGEIEVSVSGVGYHGDSANFTLTEKEKAALIEMLVDPNKGGSE